MVILYRDEKLKKTFQSSASPIPWDAPFPNIYILIFIRAVRVLYYIKKYLFLTKTVKLGEQVLINKVIDIFG